MTAFQLQSFSTAETSAILVESMAAFPFRNSSDDAAALLADGVRYERGGVVARASACFDAVTLKWREDPVSAAEAWWRLANLYRLQSQWTDALRAAATGAELSRAHGLAQQEADALNIEGAVWMTRGETARARALFERMLELTRLPSIRGKALQNLGTIAAEAREFDDAERLFAASREEYRLAGDLRGEANSLINLGRLLVERGEAALARATLEAALDASRQSGDLEMHAAALLNLGLALGELSMISEAEERITTAYGQFTIANMPMQRVNCLLQLATLASKRGESAAARVCLGHARDVAESADLPRELKVVTEQLAALPAVL
jgi:tetratricopeptide (TPR) repeat protein